MRIFLLICLFTFSLLASHINWLGNYDKALKIAKKEKKPLLVFLIKNNCQNCQDIIKKKFSNRDYIEQINKKFVSVIINFDYSNYPIELFYSTIFPTLFIVNPYDETFLTSPFYNKEIIKKLPSKLFKINLP